MSQKHNSYIIKTRLNEWLLDSVLYICYFIILLIPPFLYVWTPSKTAKYLRNIYNKNWNSNYIIDITATERECENNSEKLTLGYWSGVGKDSCLCSFENKVQFATDDNSICKKRTYKEIFNCTSIQNADPLSLEKYNGVNLCVKRNADSYTRLHTTLKNNFKNNDITGYINYLSSYNVTISSEAIVDLKISTKTDLQGYNSSIGIGNGYFLYIKKISSTNNTIYDYNDLIVSIHFSNELICSYSDMSSTSFNNKSKNYIDYGNIEYCNKFSDTNLNISYDTLYYNDENPRMKPINIDSLPINDFYTSINSNNYYSTNSINLVDNENNKLVYQQYFYGIGCFRMESPEWHYKKFKNVRVIRKIAISIMVFGICLFALGIGFKIFKLFDNCIYNPCTYYIFSFFLFFSCITVLALSSCYHGFGYNTLNYLYDFNLYCQTDFSGRNGGYLHQGSNLEKQLINDLQLVLNLNLGLIITSCFCLIFMMVYYILNCDQHRMFILLPSEHLANSRNQNLKNNMIELNTYKNKI